MRNALHACFAALVAVTPLPAAAQAPAYPSQPIRMVVAFPPGAANDFLARTIGQKLSEEWKQPVIVENRPGASGIIGGDLVAKAPADGYTLLLTSVTNVILPSLNPTMPFDPIKDFTPVALVALGPLLFVANPSVPANTVAEFIALAKSQPGKLSYGTAGNGTSVHIAVEMFKKQAGVDIVHVPYKGSSPAMMDLIAGQTQMMMDVLPSALPQVKAGKLKVIAVTGSKRLAELPDVPTVSESGLPGFDVAAWWGVVGPKGLPPAIVEKLNTTINRINAQPEMRQAFAGRGLETVTTTPAEFERVMRADEARFGAVVREVGIKAD
jgi:tripartite-type tricarboxylate transporter receptor subunit TctC